MGYKESNVFLLDEGDSIWFQKGNQGVQGLRGEKVETNNIYVDAYGVGDIGNIVLRDRKTLSSEGIVVVILMLDSQGKLTSRPRFVSRGFVFEKGEERLFGEAMHLIERTLKPRGERVLDFNNIKKEAATVLEGYFFEKRGRKPLVIVDIIEI
ncbi:hypothetical protein HY357_00610 [Candidatus Roizmanbacteria bacterium]|nr:hypothetical protein [Candidatus Roizmanbacteria bacterium]